MERTVSLVLVLIAVAFWGVISADEVDPDAPGLESLAVAKTPSNLTDPDAIRGQVVLAPYEASVTVQYDIPESAFDRAEGEMRLQKDCDKWDADMLLTTHLNDEDLDDYDLSSIRFRSREALDGSRYVERYEYTYASGESDWEQIYIERLPDGRVFGRKTSKSSDGGEESVREIQLPRDTRFMMEVTRAILHVASKGGSELSVITVDGSEESMAVRTEITVSPYKGPLLSELHPQLWLVKTQDYPLSAGGEKLSQETTVMTPSGIELEGEFEMPDGTGSMRIEARPLAPKECAPSA